MEGFTMHDLTVLTFALTMYAGFAVFALAATYAYITTCAEDRQIHAVCEWAHGRPFSMEHVSLKCWGNMSSLDPVGTLLAWVSYCQRQKVGV